MKITLVLPLPPKELSPNASTPWSANARWFHVNARKQYRRDVGTESMGKLMGSGTAGTWRRFLKEKPRLRLTETYRFADKRKRDVRNLFAAFKAGEDGLVDASILPGDDDSVLEHGAPRIERVKTKAEEGVLVEIEEIACHLQRG